MKSIFWISLAVVLYTYAGYPILIAALARLYPRPWLRARWPANTQPPISIIMAVHNGAAMLPAKIDHLLALDPTLVRELIVVSDGSTDATPNILRNAASPRMIPIVLDQHAGKAEAVNQGIAAAQGDILLFVDIRPRIAPGALTELLSNFADPTVGCVAGELVLDTVGHDATAAAVSGLYWRYEQGIRNCEAEFDSPVGVYGGFYAVRRTLATRAPKGIILDDMFQPLSVIGQGYRSVLDRTAIVVDRWPAKAAGEFDRKVRTLAGNFQLIGLAPWILTPRNRVLLQLVSHKLLRLVVPYLFLLLIMSSAFLGLHSIPFATFAIAQTAFWLMAAAALKIRIPILHRIASPASALLVLNAAAVAGLYTYLFTRGPLWKIWLPTLVPADNHLFSQKHTQS
ncbi:glycosyltransferase [Granulicella sibirica]|uniref:Glycosyl transferase, group 2 family protein n=1 Tax=Granulicella sibirica TaxID=2479048 RepID=A0A4Q0SU88_9BACT|nr:glycosyltransferase [Granulicella sibirica]RXH54585.1 Glycosyl transferase, group 2 family protein [Granulicella sibirica]